MSCSNRFSSTATAHFLNAIITDDFQRYGNHPDTLQTWLMRKHPKLAVLPLHKKPLYEASHKAYSDLHPLDNAHAERTKKAEIFRRLPLCY
ncbi:hypothetical protein [Prevotella sp. F0091]|uniref:hypothetical protein n=1 Tax=Prevotella sp. F0091 TaxID=1227276 RepID=UPI0025E829AB|nr:hypothetical protein [Prevotella sp. F0091]